MNTESEWGKCHEETEENLRTLRNGQREVIHLITATMLGLKRLFQEQPVAFYELVQKARNPHHPLFGNAGHVLYHDYGLTENKEGMIHSSIRNVILSAVQGEEFDLRLVNPIKEPE